MPDFFLARQPVYDTEMNTFGYELLYRAADETRAPAELGEQATYELLNHALNEVGFDTLVGNAYALVNIPESILHDNSALPFSGNQIILEILEDVSPSERVIQSLVNLRQQGYTIALDDFVFQDNLVELIRLAHIIKIDVLAHDEQGLKTQISELKRFGVKLLAEKVETQEQYEYCKSLGFDYYQGYFFCRPKLIQGKRLPSNQLAALKLLSRTSDPDICMDELTSLISLDASLTARLLRYTNSAFFALPKKIDSLRHAVTYLGVKLIRQWASVLVMSGIDDKPHELLVTALIRARMCETLAEQLKLDNKERFFMIGLLSVLDALLDQPMDELLSQMPLSDDITQALSQYQGDGGRLLNHVIQYQKGEWQQIDAICNGHICISPNEASSKYLQALQWARDVNAAL